MTALATSRPHLIDRLPRPRGRLAADAPLGPQTWFGAGGPAEVLFRPADTEDLAVFLQALPSDMPVTVLGVGSNLLVRDGGVKGVVVRLMGGLSGIPGTIGGAIAMNAGAYGGEIGQVLISAEAVDRGGHLHRISAKQFEFRYRHSGAPPDWIFTAARLRAEPGDQVAIAGRIAEIDGARTESQPRSRTGGSTFVNPPGHKAWELIDQAGCRGLRIGEAQVSDKHCNFLINLGGAKAADIEALGEEVRRRVLEKSGVQLEWEIRRIGVAA